MKEEEKNKFIIQYLLIATNQYENSKEDQKKLNESVDKIITWLIGFVFVFIGIVFSKMEKFCFLNLKLLITVLVSVITSGIISRVFSYLFNLSYMANLSSLLFQKEIHEKELDIKLLKNNEEIKQTWQMITETNKLLQMNSKSWVKNGLKIYKNIFVIFSVSTVLLFVTSLVIILISLF